MTSYDPIIAAVADEYGVSADDIFSRCKLRKASDARQMAMLILRDRANLKVTEIASILGRNHSTVVFAIQKLSFLIGKDKDVTQHYENINIELDKYDF